MPSASELAWLIPVLPLLGACLTGLGLGSDGATLGIGRKRVHERVDTPGIESGQILAALFDQGIGVLHGGQGSKITSNLRRSAERGFKPIGRRVEKSEDGGLSGKPQPRDRLHDPL